MIITTKQAIKILTDGLGLKSMSDCTFLKYRKLGLIVGKVESDYGLYEKVFYHESDIISSIDRIENHKASLSKKSKRKPKENLNDKEPENYTLAFGLFNQYIRKR